MCRILGNEKMKKELTKGLEYGILTSADICRCGGIGRHKGLKIPR